MNRIESNNHVHDLCVKYNTDYDQFILGYGKSYEKSTGRYVFRVGAGNKMYEKLHNHSSKYAVKYINDTSIYLIWNLAKYKRRSVFSIKRTSVQTALDNYSSSVQKAIEYSSWGEETVLVLNSKDFESFIKKNSRDAIQNSCK